jgi:SulP family sulfate permease
LLNLISHPVLMGFINAAALLICFSQLPPLLGIAGAHGGSVASDVVQLLTGLGTLDPASAAFGLGALAGLVALRRLAPRLPAVLVVAVAAIVVSRASGFAAGGGSVVGEIPQGLPALALPDLGLPEVPSLFSAALMVALVSFMEAASSAKLIAGRTRQPWDKNQELIGQGLAKLAAAASGAMPTSTSFSRTALNHQSGATTGLASLITAAAVLITLLYFTPLLWHLPKAVLAAVILQAVGNLLDFPAIRLAWRADRDDGACALLSFAATLAFAPQIQFGILCGASLSLILLIYRDMTPRVALLGLHEDGTYRDAARFGLPHPHPQIVILRFDGPLHFVNAACFEDAFLQAARALPEVKVIIVSAAGVNTIDASGLHTLTQLVDRSTDQGQQVAFCGLKKQVIEAMERDGLWARISPHAAYRIEQQAVDAEAAQLGAPKAPPPPPRL